MNETPAQPNIGRSVLCIVAGFIAVVVLSLGTDYLLHLVAGFPKLGEVYADKQFLWAAIYRTLYGIVGSYVTATVAFSRPMIECCYDLVMDLPNWEMCRYGHRVKRLMNS